MFAKSSVLPWQREDLRTPSREAHRPTCLARSTGRNSTANCNPAVRAPREPDVYSGICPRMNSFSCRPPRLFHTCINAPTQPGAGNHTTAGERHGLAAASVLLAFL